MSNNTIKEINDLIEMKIKESDDALGVHFENFDNLSEEVWDLKSQMNNVLHLMGKNIKTLNRIADGLQSVEMKIDKKRKEL